MEAIPVNFGKILIEINIDTAQYNVAFSNMDTFKLLQQHEAQMLMSPFHIVCIINEIKRRHEAVGNKIIPVSQLPGPRKFSTQ